MENNFITTYSTGKQGTVPDANLASSLCQELKAADTDCPEIFKSVKVLPDADEERELAIVFLDIRNFTSLMESQASTEIINVVRRLFTAFNQIIDNFKGKVVETAGDSLYAVFGLTTAIKEAVGNAYNATKMIFETINWFNIVYAVPQYGYPLNIGTGLHTGKVLVGNFSLDENNKLSVMGLPVNIASRLQAQTKELNNDMIVSEEAYSLLEVEDQLHEKRTISLKGLSLKQTVRLAGKPYFAAISNLRNDFDYLLAISG